MTDTWSLNDIPWDELDPHRVDPNLLAVVKAAAVVEANSADYVRYLHRVFASDASFQGAAEIWGHEERQHGDALGQWAERIDPDFNYARCLKRFQAGYQIPVDAEHSVRGSRAAELVARCVVESGTCSLYAAIRDASREPVLRTIAGFIAQDEARHYRLFQTHLQRYLEGRPMGWVERCKVAFGRVFETSDDELSYAYYSTNIAEAEPDTRYERRRAAREYSRKVLRLYEYRHLRAAGHMICRAADLNPAHRISRFTLWMVWKAVQWRTGRLPAG